MSVWPADLQNYIYSNPENRLQNIGECLISISAPHPKPTWRSCSVYAEGNRWRRICPCALFWPLRKTGVLCYVWAVLSKWFILETTSSFCVKVQCFSSYFNNEPDGTMERAEVKQANSFNSFCKGGERFVEERGTAALVAQSLTQNRDLCFSLSLGKLSESGHIVWADSCCSYHRRSLVRNIDPHYLLHLSFNPLSSVVQVHSLHLRKPYAATSFSFIWLRRHFR